MTREMENNIPRRHAVSRRTGNISPQPASPTAQYTDNMRTHPVDGIVTSLESASHAHHSTLAGLTTALDSQTA